MNGCNCQSLKLEKWSRFKELKEREGAGLAVCGSILNGLSTFWSGESKSQKAKPDVRTMGLFRCISCKTYYFKCGSCGELIRLSTMPVETKTTIICPYCHKKNLYAESDYSMGGG